MKYIHHLFLYLIASFKDCSHYWHHAWHVFYEEKNVIKHFMSLLDLDIMNRNGLNIDASIEHETSHRFRRRLLEIGYLYSAYVWEMIGTSNQFWSYEKSYLSREKF